jgi:hypothetical protein
MSRFQALRVTWRCCSSKLQLSQIIHTFVFMQPLGSLNNKALLLHATTLAIAVLVATALLSLHCIPAQPMNSCFYLSNLTPGEGCKQAAACGSRSTSSSDQRALH